MKKYRLGYDFLFLPKNSFSYKNDFIGSMAVYVLFKVFNGDGQEIIFESDEFFIEQKLHFDGDSFHLHNLVNCSFDRENILNFEPNNTLLNKFKDKLHLQWEVYGYTKDIDNDVLVPKSITEAEFMDIMQNNLDTFDNDNNRSAQTTTFFIQELKVVNSKTK